MNNLSLTEKHHTLVLRKQKNLKDLPFSSKIPASFPVITTDEKGEVKKESEHMMTELFWLLWPLFAVLVFLFKYYYTMATQNI